MTQLHVPNTTLMSLPVEVSYTQLYKEPRQRNYRDRPATETLRVSVPAVDVQDAPLVLTGRSDLSYSGRTSPDADYRMYAGRLCRQHFTQTERVSGRPDTWVPTTLALYIQKTSGLLKYDDLRVPHASDLLPKLEQRLREQGVILIEGQVYVPCAEPVYTINTHHGGQRHIWISVEVTGFDQTGTLSDARGSQQAFRADQYEDAVTQARTMVERYQQQEDSLHLPERVFTVHDAQHLRYGQLLPFVVPVKVEGTVLARVHALHQAEATDLARVRAQTVYGPLIGELHARVHSTATLDTEETDVHLRLPELDVTLAGETLSVTLGAETCRQTVPAGPGRMSVVAAAALLVIADQDTGLPLEDRLAALRGLDQITLARLDTLLAQRGTSFAQRAARGLLSAETFQRLTAQLEHALLQPA